MKIIYNNYFPPNPFLAINICGVTFARKGFGVLSKRTIHHESIHTAQIKEMLYLFFYLWYVVEWLVRIIQYRNIMLAYRNISFEREAYENDQNFEYLKTRKWFGWVRYLSQSK